MTTFFTNRFFIATMSIFLGASSMWAYDKITTASAPFSKEPEILIQDILSQNFLKDGHDSFFINMNTTQITRREDQQNIYYDLDFGDKKATELNVDVKNGQINIFGKIEHKNESGNLKSFFQSSFQRSFPAPSEADVDKFKVTEEDQKIVIILPKKTSI